MREAVGLFETMEQLQTAVKELERVEFPRDSLSVLGEHKTIETGFRSHKMEALQDDENAPREVPVRPEEKTIGTGALVSGAAYVGAMGLALAAGAVTIPAILTAAAIGGLGGATVGGVLAKILGDHFHHDIEKQVEEGGLLLWVRTPDEEKEKLAAKILTDQGAHHVKIIEH